MYDVSRTAEPLSTRIDSLVPMSAQHVEAPGQLQSAFAVVEVTTFPSQPAFRRSSFCVGAPPPRVRPQTANLSRSGRPDLNRRHPAPKAGALPTALRPVSRRERRKADDDSRKSASAQSRTRGRSLSRQRRIREAGAGDPLVGVWVITSATACPAARSAAPRSRPAPRNARAHRLEDAGEEQSGYRERVPDIQQTTCRQS